MINIGYIVIIITITLLEAFDIELKTTILEFNEIQVKGLFTSRLGYESVDIIDTEKIIIHLGFLWLLDF